MARPSNTDARRAQIIEGLLLVMAAKGYERASVNEVAEAAGLSSGLVHYHFKDKQEILLGLLELLAERQQQRLEAELARPGRSARQRLDGFIDAHLKLGPGADPRAVKAWVALSAEAIRQPAVSGAYAQAVARSFEQLEQLVREALTETRDSSVGAKTISAAVFAAIQGYFMLAGVVPALVPAGSAASTVKKMLASLLEKEIR